MKERTHLNKAISGTTSTKAEYDENVKNLFADVQVLSRILKYTVAEVEALSVEEIIGCIDRDSIEVSKVPVEPGLTNYGKVESVQTENVIQNEGRVLFDIRFSLTRQEMLLRIIVNVEAQKSSKLSILKYHLENRIIFYLSRLISSQKDVEFFHSDYDNLKKVYSIWICVDTNDGDESINKIYLTSEAVFGKKQVFTQLDKLCGIVVRIRKLENVEESKHRLIAMLEDLLANEEAEKKKQKLVDKYNMVMDIELERSVTQMCNLSDGIWEDGQIQLAREIVVEILNEKDDVSESLCQQITGQCDLEVLKRWVRLAVVSDSVEEFEQSM